MWAGLFQLSQESLRSRFVISGSGRWHIFSLNCHAHIFCCVLASNLFEVFLEHLPTFFPEHYRSIILGARKKDDIWRKRDNRRAAMTPHSQVTSHTLCAKCIWHEKSCILEVQQLGGIVMRQCGIVTAGMAKTGTGSSQPQQMYLRA